MAKLSCEQSVLTAANLSAEKARSIYSATLSFGASALLEKAKGVGANVKRGFQLYEGDIIILPALDDRFPFVITKRRMRGGIEWEELLILVKLIRNGQAHAIMLESWQFRKWNTTVLRDEAYLALHPDQKAALDYVNSDLLHSDLLMADNDITRIAMLCDKNSEVPYTVHVKTLTCYDRNSDKNYSFTINLFEKLDL